MRQLCVVAVLLAAACHGRRDLSPDADQSVPFDAATTGDQSSFSDDLECVQCSPDLRSVLDCQGNVLKTCPVDQGCAPGGVCEPACQSAIDDHSSVGCEYYAISPPDFVMRSCFAAFIANTWDTPVTINVSYGATTLDVTKFAYVPMGVGKAITYAPLTTGVLPAGSIAILFLSDDNDDCPVATAPISGAGFNSAGIGTAFHITTSAPVIAYDIFSYGGGSSLVTGATLLLPVSAWDVNYVATTAYPQTVTGLPDTNPWLGFVAAQDATHVVIKPTVAIVGGTGIAAGPANTPITYTLSKGELLRLSQATDLSGSLVVSDKPIGLWGGNTCAYLPAAVPNCDGMHQQLPSVQQLGHEYAAVRYRNRLTGFEETPPWRLVGIVDGTTLTYDPATPAGAPTTLGKGQVIEFNAAGPFDLKSQDASHPFYFAAHMTGCSTLGISSVGCAGDPEFVNVIPQEQYLSPYVFFTDPTYPETNLVFVRRKGNEGMFHDVNLDCYGTLVGWMPVDTEDNFEYTRTDLVTGNFTPVGACNNGRHSVSSTAPFTFTVWGWGTALATSQMSTAVSYAYPGGAGLRTINDVVVPIQ